MENNIRTNDLSPIYQQIATIVGLENAVRLGEEFGGEALYLPKLDLCLAKVRKRKILEEFCGGNYAELAKKYGVTSAWVRQIIKKNRRKEVLNVG